VGESYLASGADVHLTDAHRDALRRMQNADGGWGYFPGKQSWLEPTAYAAIALHGEPAADRAWTLIQSWQLNDGGWRPAADVHIPNWTTSLCVTIATLRGELGDPFQKGVEWLLQSSGQESELVNRAKTRVGIALGVVEADRDFRLKGWPWKTNTSSWVEPTAHAIVALKQASSKVAPQNRSELRERVLSGEAQLLDVRGKDGGWNYGSRAALGVDLPSYPETTALALLGLQGHEDLAQSVARATQMVSDPLQGAEKSRLSRAWLRIALRLHGVSVDLPAELKLTQPLRDVVITALDVIGAGAAVEAFRAGETS
jgi:hypothetical protein